MEETCCIFQSLMPTCQRSSWRSVPGSSMRVVTYAHMKWQSSGSENNNITNPTAPSIEVSCGSHISHTQFKFSSTCGPKLNWLTFESTVCFASLLCTWPFKGFSVLPESLLALPDLHLSLPHKLSMSHV